MQGAGRNLSIGRTHVRERQIQGEGTAAAGDTAQAYFAAQQVSQLTADGESQSRATVFTRRTGVRLLKRLEDDSLLLLRNADTRVADGELHHRRRLAERRVIGCPTAHRDTDMQAYTAAVRKLERVGQEVLQHLQQALGVGRNRASQARVEIRSEGQLAGIRLVPEIAFDRFAQMREQQVFALDRDRAGLDLGQVQDVADEIEQVGTGTVNGFGELDLAVAQVLVGVLRKLL